MHVLWSLEDVGIMLAKYMSHYHFIESEIHISIDSSDHSVTRLAGGHYNY